MAPWFSVLVATRDRPETLARALGSILEQRCRDLEVVVVDDGSGPPARRAAALAPLADEPRLRWVELPRRRRGHGPALARNSAAAAATGRYLAVLDDDDLWTDRDHLTRAREALAAAARAGGPAGLYLANQHAFRAGRRLERELWLEGLAGRLRAAKRAEFTPDVFDVTVDELVDAGGFCHLNTTIVARPLFEAIGGFDETLPYEEDRDLYLRAIDAADRILYAAAVVARHDVPDPERGTTASSQVALLDKRLHQYRLLARAGLSSRRPAVRRFATRHGGYTLRRLAEELAGDRRYADAARCARTALGHAPTLKWLGYTLYLHARSAGPGRRRAEDGTGRSGRSA
jgi:glycosyltransferase involved in cell wall biosynthesis